MILLDLLFFMIASGRGDRWWWFWPLSNSTYFTGAAARINLSKFARCPGYSTS